MLIFIFALSVLLPQNSSAARPGGYECESPYPNHLETRLGGLRWTTNGEPRSEAEARQWVRWSCRDALGWNDPLGTRCKSAAAEARCYPVDMFYCSGTANVMDGWGRREGARRENLRLGAVYLEKGILSEQRERIREAFPIYCAYAQGRNLFSAIPEKDNASFCEEAQASLKCE